MKKKLTLALETGIYGGSVCLLNNGREISSWIGESGQTKSREFLESIKQVLYGSQTGIRDVCEIVISGGPGSYTGLRIGFSIAKGFKLALGINIRTVSPLDEMLKGMRPITIAALPFGKKDVCWKEKTNKKSEPSAPANSIKFNSKIDFVKIIKQWRPENLILPLKLYNELSEFMIFTTVNLNVVYTDKNLAHLIGKSSRNIMGDEEVKIFYPKPFKVE